jgi:lysyl-tRNA synthetase class 2
VRLDYFEAIKKHAGSDFKAIEPIINMSKEVEKAVWKDDSNSEVHFERSKLGVYAASEAKRHGLTVDPKSSDMEIVNEIFEKVVQDKLIQPTFVIDYPVELCPLAKTKASDPSRAERFEFFIRGQEIANAYSELNDPIDQAKRFEEQSRILGKNSDDDFVRALEHGMPCAGGLGIGIDRLVMILTGTESIREVIFFPQLRPEAK